MPVEEQTQYNTSYQIRGTGYYRWGQKLTVPYRAIKKLSFPIHKLGIPGTDNVTFGIRKVSDGSLITSKVWGQAVDLPASATWEEVEFDAAATIDEEVYIYVEFTGGSADNCVMSNYQNTDVKANENTVRYQSSWGDLATLDTAYRYTWEEPGPPPAVTVVSSSILGNKETEQGSILVNRNAERPGVLSNVESPGGAIFSNVGDERSGIRSGRA